MIYYLLPPTHSKWCFPNTTTHRRSVVQNPMFEEHLLSSKEHSLGNYALEKMGDKEEKF